jgi:DNA repair protein RadA
MSLDANELIHMIADKSDLDEGKIKEKVEAKRTELNGLITLEGAAHIIAGELGINFLEGLVEAPRLKLENVIPGMSSVDVVGRLTQLFEVRSFEKSDSVKGKVASGILSDDTSAVRIVFWDKNAESVEDATIKEGDIIKLRDGYTKENRNGEAEIHVGNRALLIVNPEDVEGSGFPKKAGMQKKLSELAAGMQGVDVAVKVLRSYEPREFTRDDGSTGRVANLLVADETKSARVVLWDDDVGLVESGELKEGDLILIKKGYVRERLEEFEVHVGRYGKVVLNPPDVTLDEVVEAEHGRARRTNIEALAPDMKAEVRGALARIYDNPTIYEKDGEKRFVVNGVVDDGTGRLHAVFFNKMGELLLNTTINALVEGDPFTIVHERERELEGREIIIAGNVRQNETTGRIELIVFDIDLDPDPKAEIESLLKEAGALIGDKYKEMSSVAASSASELKDAAGIGEGAANRIIIAAKESLDIRFRTGTEMLEKRKLVKKIRIGSTALDELLGGGIETQAISEFYGEFGSGKTQIVHQAAVNVQLPEEEGGLGKGVIFIDTENTFRPERIIQMAEGRGVDPEKILDNIQVARAYNSADQILWAEKAAEMAQSGDIGLIVVDSLTSQFRADYVGRGTLADRQQKLNRHMHTLQRAGDLNNISVIVTNQVMAKPDTFFGDPTTPIGGHIVGHTSTFRLYLRKSKGGKRVARLMDSPNLPDGEAIFMVTQEGIKD